MADLSQLTDEQLGVYRDLLLRKQGQAMAQNPPGPAQPPQPLGLQPGANLQERITNQPRTQFIDTNAAGFGTPPARSVSPEALGVDADMNARGVLNMVGKGNTIQTRLQGAGEAFGPALAAAGGAMLGGGQGPESPVPLGRVAQAAGAGTKAAILNAPIIRAPIRAAGRAMRKSWEASAPQTPTAPPGAPPAPPSAMPPAIRPPIGQTGGAPQAPPQATPAPQARTPLWQQVGTQAQAPTPPPEVNPIKFSQIQRRTPPSQVRPPVAQAAPAAQPQAAPQVSPAPALESAPQGGAALKPGETAISAEQVPVKKGGLGEYTQTGHDARLDAMRPHFEDALNDPAVRAAIEAGDPNWNPNPPGKIGSNITNNWDGLRLKAGLKNASRIRKPEAPFNTPERLLDEEGLVWGSKAQQAAAVGGPPTMPQPVQQQQAGPAAAQAPATSPPNIIRMVANAVPKEGIGISELRENLPQLSKQELDQAVMDLYRSNKIDLDAHDFPQGETPEDLARMTVPDGKGNYYIMAGRK